MKMPLLLVALLLLLTACTNNSYPSSVSEAELAPKGEVGRSIAQSDVTEFKQKLEELFGFPDSVQYVNPETKNSYSYDFNINDNYELTYASFSITYGNSQPVDRFLNDAKGYFLCCATLAKEPASVKEAKEFINESILGTVDQQVTGGMTFQFSMRKENHHFSLFSVSAYLPESDI